MASTINHNLLDLLNDPGQTPAEAQKILKCGNTKFWDLVKRGNLNGYYIGRCFRVPLSEIKRYRETHAKKLKAA